jgi:hypothetical protein
MFQNGSGRFKQHYTATQGADSGYQQNFMQSLRTLHCTWASISPTLDPPVDAQCKLADAVYIKCPEEPPQQEQGRATCSAGVAADTAGGHQKELAPVALVLTDDDPGLETSNAMDYEFEPRTPTGRPTCCQLDQYAVEPCSYTMCGYCRGLDMLPLNWS